MRVLSVAFAGVPVGTAHGGGAEQILSVLEEGLIEAGYESVVVASTGSGVAGELIETPAENAAWEAHRDAIEATLARHPIDLIHFHGLDFHEYVPDWDVPMLATLHLPVSFYPPFIFDGRVRLNCVSQSQA